MCAEDVFHARESSKFKTRGWKYSGVEQWKNQKYHGNSRRRHESSDFRLGRVANGFQGDPVKGPEGAPLLMKSGCSGMSWRLILITPVCKLRKGCFWQTFPVLLLPPSLFLSTLRDNFLKASGIFKFCHTLAGWNVRVSTRDPKKATSFFQSSRRDMTNYLY